MLLLKHLLYCIYLFHQQIYIEYLLTSTYYSSSQPTVANTQIPWYEVYIVEGNTGTNFTNFSDKFYEIIKEWCSLRIDRAMSDFFLKGGCAGRPSLKQWHLVESCIMWGSEDQKKKAEDKQACKSREQGVHVVGTARTPTELPEDEKRRKVVKDWIEGIERVGYWKKPWKSSKWRTLWDKEKTAKEYTVN